MGNETALQRFVIDGGFMMILLIPLALLTIAFIVQGFINLRGGRVAPASFAARLPSVLADCQTRDELEAMLERQGHSLAAILRRVVRHLEFKPDADPAELLDMAIEEEATLLQQRNSQLSLVYNIAPLMGLLGTVFGLLQTFADYTKSADPSLQELSQGVNVALITTAWGLSIAIPAFIFMYIFTRRINRYEQVTLPRESLQALGPMLRALRSFPKPESSASGENV